MPFISSTLELVYWVALGLGLIVLAISVVLGDIFDFFDIDIGDSGLPIVPVFFAAMATFGAGGLIAIEAFGFGSGGSIAVGLGTGVGGAVLAGLLFFFLRRQEAGDGFEMSQLVGQRGRVTLAVGPGKVGRVAVSFGGLTRSFSAGSAEEIPPGEDIVVTDVVGHTIKVARPDRAPAPERG